MAAKNENNNTPSSPSPDDFDETIVYKPQSSAMKRKKPDPSTSCTMAIAPNGVLFGTENDDPFGHLTPNVPIEGERCAYLFNVNHKEGRGSVAKVIPMKTREWNEDQPFTPPSCTKKFELKFKAVNVYKHPCAKLFADGKNGTTIAFPALAYSRKILKYVKDLCGDLVICDIQEEDVHCEIRYFKRCKGNRVDYFVKELEPIYWLRETLE
eukprot:scaffold113993_cov18-Prasinocladus_malaysianus.AAC.1